MACRHMRVGDIATHPSHCCHTPSERALWYPLSERLGESQSWSGHFRDEKNFLTLLGIKPPQFYGCAAQSLDTTPTELSELLMVN